MGRVRDLCGDLIDSVWPRSENSWLAIAEMEIFREGTRHGPVLMAGACLGMAAACAPWVPAITRWSWGITAAALSIIVYAASLTLLPKSPTSLRDIRIRIVSQIGFIAVSTIAWCSMTVFLWVPNAPTNHMLLIFALAASLSGTITMSASHSVTAAVVIGLHAVFLILPPALSPDMPDHVMAALAGIFIFLLVVQTSTLHPFLKRVLTLEHERSGLVDGLKLAKQESDRERARAAAAGRTRSQFLSNMNHELRTPMNAILGFSELIKQKAFGTSLDKYAEYGDIIHQSGQHLLRLIDDMLDLAKIEGGKLSLRESEVNLARLLADQIAENEAQAAAARLSLIKRIPPDLPRVHADERALRQIAANLISNALKFTPSGGCITLFADLRDDGRIAFGVDDTGIGISEEEQLRVFERFGQGRHDVTTADKGTGLGLAIVKGFAEAHDGEVKLESALGVGTRVTAYLPRERVRLPAFAKAG